MPNQHKPCRQCLIFLQWLIGSDFFLAPDEDIRGPLEEYFRLGCSDVDITELLKAHYDITTHGLR
jgi:hypothetical protein